MSEPNRPGEGLVPPEPPTHVASTEQPAEATPAEPGPPSAEPTASGPASAEPTVTMPAAGPYPAPQQQSSPPVSGAPYGELAMTGVPAAVGERRGRGLLVATILAVFLFLAAGAMTGLYLVQTGELDETKKKLTAQISERDTKITEQTGEIDKLKKDVQATKDEVEKVKQDLSGTQNTAEELKRQKAVISRCLNLLAEANHLADQGQTAQARAKLNEANPVCDEADRYLE